MTVAPPASLTHAGGAAATGSAALDGSFAGVWWRGWGANGGTGATGRGAPAHPASSSNRASAVIRVMAHP